MTANRYVDIFESYNRFATGDKIQEKDWDYGIVPYNASLMKKRYDIDFGGQIIPEDQDLVDRLFLAGVDMLLTCGVYNISTGTRLVSMLVFTLISSRPTAFSPSDMHCLQIACFHLLFR